MAGQTTGAFSTITMLGLINVLCLTLTLAMTEWLALDALDVITRPDEEMISAFLIISSILSMALILFGKIKTTPPKDKKYDAHHYVVIVGLLLFGVLAVLFYMLDFSAAVECVKAVSKEFYGNSDNFGPLQMELFIEVMHAIIYMLQALSIGCQLVFLTIYRGRTVSTSGGKLCVLVILTANSSLYINTFLRESQEKLDYKPKITQELLDHLKLRAGNTSKVFKCVNRTTGQDEEMSILHPYIYPFDLEFYLVAAGILLSMLLSGNEPGSKSEGQSNTENKSVGNEGELSSTSEDTLDDENSDNSRGKGKRLVGTEGEPSSTSDDTLDDENSDNSRGKGKRLVGRDPSTYSKKSTGHSPTNKHGNPKERENSDLDLIKGREQPSGQEQKPTHSDGSATLISASHTVEAEVHIENMPQQVNGYNEAQSKGKVPRDSSAKEQPATDISQTVQPPPTIGENQPDQSTSTKIEVSDQPGGGSNSGSSGVDRKKKIGCWSRFLQTGRELLIDCGGSGGGGGGDQPRGGSNSGSSGVDRKKTDRTPLIDNSDSGGGDQPCGDSGGSGDVEILKTEEEEALHDSKIYISAFVIALLASILLIVFEVLCYVPDIQQTQLITFYVIRLSYYMLLLGISAFGVWLVIIEKSESTGNHQIHPEIILLFVAATGEFIYLLFGAISATAGFNERKRQDMIAVNQYNTSMVFRYDGPQGEYTLITVCALTFVGNIIDIIHISLQTLLLTIAERKSKIEWNGANQWKRKAFIAIAWYLCACNFAKWISESFFEDYILKNSEAKTMVFLTDARTALTQSTYPLVLFYRFHSGMMFVALLGKVKPRKNNDESATQPLCH